MHEPTVYGGHPKITTIDGSSMDSNMDWMAYKIYFRTQSLTSILLSNMIRYPSESKTSMWINPEVPARELLEADL
jgi:hypothetical protein